MAKKKLIASFALVLLSIAAIAIAHVAVLMPIHRCLVSLDSSLTLILRGDCCRPDGRK